MIFSSIKLTSLTHSCVFRIFAPIAIEHVASGSCTTGPGRQTQQNPHVHVHLKKLNLLESWNTLDTFEALKWKWKASPLQTTFETTAESVSATDRQDRISTRHRRHRVCGMREAITAVGSCVVGSASLEEVPSRI